MAITSGGDGAAAAHNPREALLYARLITLMGLAEESAEIAYPRRLHMPDIHRQLIFMIGMFGSATSKQLMAASGREKAQVSRGVKALTEADLIIRPDARSAMRLNRAGEAIFSEIMRIGSERNDALCAGIPPEHIARFLAITATLIDRASSIYIADEKSGAIDPEQRSVLHHPPEMNADLSKVMAGGPSFRELVLPWLQSLMTYLRRSGANLFLREMGMTIFEWRILSQIQENQPVTLSGLIALVARDKSQVARMVKQLHAAGFVDRRDEGRVNIGLTLTGEGRERYVRICEIGEERDRFMFAGSGTGDRAFYIGMFDRLGCNARAMLESERSNPVRKASAAAPALAAPAALEGDPELDTLRKENARLKKLLAEAMLEISLLNDR